MSKCAVVACVVFAFEVSGARAATWHVSTNGNDAAAGTNWATAKQTIQAACDLAVSNDMVLVSNGVYATGGRVMFGSMTNRVAVSNAVTLMSLNGPAVTFIAGAADPLTTNGNASVRCVWLGSNCVLSGFTLTNGHTRQAGDFYNELCGGGVWAGADPLVSNCVVTGSSAYNYGGGAYRGRLYNCVLSGNAARVEGGGTWGARAYNCTYTGNRMSGTFPTYTGGGASGGTAYGCVFYRNSSAVQGGGVGGTAFIANCTVVNNSAAASGGGVSACTVTNSIVFHNTAPTNANHASSAIIRSCTTPLPAGTGNITNEPVLASLNHLSTNSPCIAQCPTNAGGVDIDGEAWQAPASMGCDEIVPGSITGPLGAFASVSAFTMLAGSNVTFTVVTTGRTSRTVWDFADGTFATNQAVAVHSFAASGTYAVVVRAFNETFTAGVTATVTVQVLPSAYFVAPGGGNVAPFDTWAKAATTLQAAVDVAPVGATVWVSNGVYNSGGRHGGGGLLTNRVAITNAVAVRSINGPAVTVIAGAADPVSTNGNAAVRCAYVGTNAVLSGFTLTNGHNRTSGAVGHDVSGGGVYGALLSSVSNCVVTGCRSAAHGGGANGGTFYNCVFSGNKAVQDGGGTYSAALNNCILTGNSAAYGGGAAGASFTLRGCAIYGNTAAAGGGTSGGTLYQCTLAGNTANQGGGANNGTFYNCIVYFNTAPFSNNYNGASFQYSCTTPMPVTGPGNLTNDPQMASLIRISTNSPCIAAGSTSIAGVVAADIDGEPWKTPPSMGCDEIHAGSITGPIGIAAAASPTGTITGVAIAFTATITGRVTGCTWDFGDGSGATNLPFAAHAFASTGMFTVVARAHNDTFPAGVAATVTVQISQGDFFVAPGGGNIAPYETWAKAATTIQPAVDLAPAGAVIWVSNGVYNTGGRVVNGAMTNRIVITNAVHVRAANGPSVTSIAGRADPAATNGDAAVRCVYMGSNSSLAGFTISNGHTRAAGDAQLEQSGGGIYTIYSALESPSALVSNCVILANTAAQYGGGVRGGTLRNCVITENAATVSGGGVASSWMYNSTVSFNTAGGGGGGGLEGVLAFNCGIYGNTAGVGGGSHGGGLYNCTVAGNTATDGAGGGGGGVNGGVLYNCIVFFNMSDSNANYASGASIQRSCTLPLAAGAGNISSNPQLSSLTHISTSSPCIGLGSASFSVGVDADGEAWKTPPAAGCDEVYAGTITGQLDVTAFATPTNCLPGQFVSFFALINGRPIRSTWDFADGTAILTNEPFVTHAFAVTGTYFVVLRAFNDTYPAGVAATVAVNVISADYFVAPGGGNIAPYDTWAKAGTNIQTVIDSVSTGAIVWVSNGVYNTGGRVMAGSMTNRVAIDKSVTVRSVNGPAVTIIAGRADPLTTNGDAAVRCVFVGTNAVLSGFTLTNGHTRTGGDFNQEDSGGGVWCSAGGIVSNCVISGNGARFGGGSFARSATYPLAGGTLKNCVYSGNVSDLAGGGSYYGSLIGCIMTGNRAGSSGGGASVAALANCLLIGNTASTGGGSDGCFLTNCTVVANTATSFGPSGGGGGTSYGIQLNSIVYFNSAPTNANTLFGSFTNSCTTPLPAAGTGNITSDPFFMNAAATNYRLSARSPCVNKGSNEVVTAATDFDGNPRVVDGRVDIGAYELQGPPFTGTWFVAVSGSDGAAGTSWEFPFQTIQAAANVAWSGELILVSNGTYSSGGRVVNGSLTNRVALTNAVTLQSVNGPAVTIIEGRADPVSTNGNAAVRCVYLAANARLDGFTLTNGHTRTAGDAILEQSGGGVFLSSGARASNCVVTGSSAANLGGGAFAGTLLNSTISGNSAVRGGGLHGGIASNCILSGNSAQFGGGSFTSRLVNSLVTFNAATTNGGGSHGGLLVNCTLASNTAAIQGGGSYSGTLHNAIVYFNTAPAGSNWVGSAFTSGCTVPLPPGLNNITANPLFANPASGNFRLGAGSPCVNAGSNQLAQGLADLDGGPRILDGRVDLGAYERSLTGYDLFALQITNGLAAPEQDADTDGYANLLEYATGGNPTNADTAARMNAAITNGIFALRFTRATNATDATLIVQGSFAATNGAPWLSIAINSNGAWSGSASVTETGASPVTVAVQDTEPFATNRHLRLKVTRP